MGAESLLKPAPLVEAASLGGAASPVVAAPPGASAPLDPALPGGSPFSVSKINRIDR